MARFRSGVVNAMLLGGLVGLTLASPADARRGGSFGSRGSRTYYAPRPTQVTPGYTPGLSRSMTPRSPYGAPRYAPSYQPSQNRGYRPRSGFGGGLLGGLLAGGLIGSILGHGMGGYGGAGGGLLALLFQLAILGGILWLVVRLFRGRQSAPLTSPAPQPFTQGSPGLASNFDAGPSFGGGASGVAAGDIPITSADQNAFEALLIELQDAFGHEDYGRLRAITTPEIMSYLAEELSDNATHGRKNDVTGTRLIDAEVSEAWREADADYATVAMRYESIDVMRDRTSGAILEGDPTRPTQATEIWTFTRPAGPWAAWNVSAIQEA